MLTTMSSTLKDIQTQGLIGALTLKQDYDWKHALRTRTFGTETTEGVTDTMDEYM